ncbi:MAG: phosphoribosylanthranilate isomerase [Acidobacteriota bacterium]
MKRVSVKICGIANESSLDAALEAGVDLVGFVFATSPRQVTVAQAAALAARLPAHVGAVAVFRQPTRADVSAVLEAFEPDYVQADDRDEAGLPPLGESLLVPVVRGAAIGAEALFARHGQLLIESENSGQGQPANWERAAQLAQHGELWLAGGLNARNVAEAIERVRPRVVDVSSGVESAPGIKDPKLCGVFVRVVRAAVHRLKESAT